MIALARITRKTIRQGRSGPVRTLAWFIVALELFLTFIYIRSGAGGWGINLFLAVLMLGCILGEDYVNGIVGLRQVMSGGQEVNTTFKEQGYVQRTQAGESWRPYTQIRAIGENKDYFVLALDKSHGQIYAKEGFSWGSAEEFRTFIQRKTGLKIQKVR